MLAEREKTHAHINIHFVAASPNEKLIIVFYSATMHPVWQAEIEKSTIAAAVRRN